MKKAFSSDKTGRALLLLGALLGLASTTLLVFGIVFGDWGGIAIGAVSLVAVAITSYMVGNELRWKLRG